MIRYGRNCFLPLRLEDVLYVEAQGDYAKICLAGEKYYLIAGSLASLETQMPAHLFCRIHRCYIVSLQKIVKIEGDVLRVHDREFPIGRTYREALLERFRLIG